MTLLHSLIRLSQSSIILRNTTTINTTATPLVNKLVSLFSIPCSLGQPFTGTDQSPKLLKENGLLQLLSNIGWRIKTIPEIISIDTSTPASYAVETALNAKNIESIGRTCELIKESIYNEAKNTSNFILIIGGDHCMSIGL
jgi:arginase family enzyme